MTSRQFFLYLVTIFVASIMPGPSMLLALTHGMKYGAKRTVASALGNVTVTLIQAAISITGLQAILLASEGLFGMIKLAGAVYLIYMGLNIWRSPSIAVLEEPGSDLSSEVPLRKMYFQAALVTAGNPKAIIFFTAVFPQFIDSNAPYIPQFSLLMGAGAFLAFGCFMIYATVGQRIVALFAKSTIGKYINKVIGGTFIGAGIGLAASNK